MRNSLLVVPALITCVVFACRPQRSQELVVASPAQVQGLRPVSDFRAIEGEQERARALMQELGKVLLHPRCVNCHPAGSRPLQGEDGAPHQPFVVGDKDGKGAPGLPCTACHGESNYLNVPGRSDWHLAPLEMAWEGKSLGQICGQLKDRERNGGRSLSEMTHHAQRDDLVAYGWDPPEHLRPAPGNQRLFGELFAAWVDSGAHCPE